jgi:hypothetical protein
MLRHVATSGRLIVSSSEGTVAGDFFCIAFDERKGRSRLPDQLTGIGLASALLAELLISGHMAITVDGEIDVLYVQPPGEPVAKRVYDLIQENREQHDLVTWIRYLGRTAYADVARRLVDGGVIRPVLQRGIVAESLRRLRAGRPRERHEPVNSNRLAWPAVRIANMLGQGPDGAYNLPDLTCAGLATATGLIDHVLWDSLSHAKARAALPAFMAALPPALAMLLARTESLVGDAVLTNRT